MKETGRQNFPKGKYISGRTTIYRYNVYIYIHSLVDMYKSNRKKSEKVFTEKRTTTQKL
jgi:hypothetical protein